MNEYMDIISLGAGVQSSTMALMAAHGEIAPMPIAAIFADTHDEPRSVMEWLLWLEKQLPFPIIRVSVGKLSLASTAVRKSALGGYLKPVIPVFFDREGKKGKAARHCTADFKITPIHRCIKQIRGTAEVSQWMGISTDEADRMAPDVSPVIHNRYPLIDTGMSRDDCYSWMAKMGYPKPPRSACVFCPFHSDDEWIRLRDHEPEEFARAVKFEQDYQAAVKHTRLDGIPFLHAARIPLATVTFVPNKGKGKFSNECRGMCGV